MIFFLTVTHFLKVGLFQVKYKGPVEVIFHVVAAGDYPVGVFIGRFPLIRWGNEFVLSVKPFAVARLVPARVFENDFFLFVFRIEQQVDASVFFNFHVLDDLFVSNEGYVGTKVFVGAVIICVDCSDQGDGEEREENFGRYFQWKLELSVMG